MTFRLVISFLFSLIALTSAVRAESVPLDHEEACSQSNIEADLRASFQSLLGVFKLDESSVNLKVLDSEEHYFPIARSDGTIVFERAFLSNLCLAALEFASEDVETTLSTCVSKTQDFGTCHSQAARLHFEELAVAGEAKLEDKLALYAKLRAPHFAFFLAHEMTHIADNHFDAIETRALSPRAAEMVADIAGSYFMGPQIYPSFYWRMADLERKGMNQDQFEAASQATNNFLDWVATDVPMEVHPKDLIVREVHQDFNCRYEIQKIAAFSKYKSDRELLDSAAPSLLPFGCSRSLGPDILQAIKRSRALIEKIENGN